jgi:hypothetical protein
MITLLYGVARPDRNPRVGRGSGSDCQTPTWVARHPPFTHLLDCQRLSDTHGLPDTHRLGIARHPPFGECVVARHPLFVAAGSPWGLPPRGRVRRWRYRHPLPSELHVKVSLHAAQAFTNAPRRTRPLATAFTIRAWSRRTVRQTFLHSMECQSGVRSGAAPVSISAADISACLPESVGQGSLVTEHLREVGPLSRRGDVVRGRTHPLSDRLPNGIGLLPHPLPAAPSATPYGGPTLEGGRRA